MLLSIVLKARNPLFYMQNVIVFSNTLLLILFKPEYSQVRWLSNWCMFVNMLKYRTLVY